MNMVIGRRITDARRECGWRRQIGKVRQRDRARRTARLEDASLPELPQVMVHVAPSPTRPLPFREFAEHEVRTLRHGGKLADEALDRR
jgi:hypothetical protein